MDFGAIFAVLGIVIPVGLWFLANKMGKQIAPLGKAILVGVILWSGMKTAVHFNLLPENKAFQALTLEKIDVKTDESLLTTGSRSMTKTSDSIVVSSRVPAIRASIYGWSAQNGFTAANGGKSTKKGSLMDQHGVDLNFERVDSNDTLAAQAMAFAKAIKAGERHPSAGAHIIAMMGSGTGPFLSQLNAEIDKNLGKEYRYKIIGSSGQSFGEDKWLIPASWVKDPSVARPELRDIHIVEGKVVITVPKDGDEDIIKKWASDNGTCINTDPKILDMRCINIEPAPEGNYMKSAEVFASGGQYSREKVRQKDGKVVDTPVKGNIDSVSTWYPGDKYVFEHSRTQMVSLADTKLYSGMMPQALMINIKWAQDNPLVVEALLSAMYEAGDQILRDPKALTKAAQVAAEVYAEGTGADWEAAYRGIETNKDGVYLRLGGSRVYNLADAYRIFGLESGRENLFKAAYDVFGQATAKLYPGDVPTLIPFDEVSDLSFLKKLEGKVASGVADTGVVTTSTGANARVGTAQLYINFLTNRADFAGGAEQQLNDLKQSLSLCGGCSIELRGYTDSQGSNAVNIPLSKARAEAVKDWLTLRAGSSFKDKIISDGYGSADPIGDNKTDAGRRQNRRVEVRLFSRQ